MQGRHGNQRPVRAMLRVWRPPEELQSAREGEVYIVYNLNAYNSSRDGCAFHLTQTADPFGDPAGLHSWSVAVDSPFQGLTIRVYNFCRLGWSSPMARECAGSCTARPGQRAVRRDPWRGTSSRGRRRRLRSCHHLGGAPTLISPASSSSSRI